MKADVSVSCRLSAGSGLQWEDFNRCFFWVRCTSERSGELYPMGRSAALRLSQSTSVRNQPFPFPFGSSVLSEAKKTSRKPMRCLARGYLQLRSGSISVPKPSADSTKTTKYGQEILKGIQEAVCPMRNMLGDISSPGVICVSVLKNTLKARLSARNWR